MQPMTLREIVNEWWAFKGTGPITPQVLAELEKAEAAVACCHECDKWLETVISKTSTDEQRRIADQQYDNVRLAWPAARDAAAKFRTNQ